jgi:uncharacterized membrane protein YebE (DUF533 family)
LGFPSYFLAGPGASLPVEGPTLLANPEEEEELVEVLGLARVMAADRVLKEETYLNTLLKA